MPNPFTQVRVRYAPSPTGFLHIGNLRTALFNWLFAKKHGGTFVLRIEDTDRARFVEGGIENICRSLKATGVIPDEGIWLDDEDKIIERGAFAPYLQSKRREKHLAYAEKLIAEDKAYYCFCSSERLEELRKSQELMKQPTMYDGKCRTLDKDEAAQRATAGESHVIRLKLPKEGTIKINDLIRGEIEFQWKLIDDQVIVKSDGYPTYHLAAMCDDHDMEISHVIRGEEWLSSLPKHVFIYQALGWEPPQYAHLPLLLNPDRSKLSKRQGDVAVEDYLNKGYLPAALINFIALLGWNPSGEREIYTPEELAGEFELEKVNKGGAVFNLEKLDWLNEHYLKSLSQDEYLALTLSFIQSRSDDQNFCRRAVLLVRDRVHLPSQVAELTDFLFVDTQDYSSVSLTWKNQDKEQAVERLEAVKDLIGAWNDSYFEIGNGRLKIESAIKQLIADQTWGNGDTLWPVRVALSGLEKSPGPFELIETYGKEYSLKRLEEAIDFLNK
ncbi:MAG: glutamate--tRNA ligase [Patescibacteria group bacterium]